MDTKEEIIEEIDEIENLSTDSKPEEKIKNEESSIEGTPAEVSVVEPIIKEDTLPEESINNDMVVENKLKEESNVADETTASEIQEEKKEETNSEHELSKKSKTPVIIILSVLLVLDIAALVVYIIGIEKVISFIK